MNKMFKRILAIAMALMLIVSIAGCSSQDGSFKDTFSQIMGAFGIDVPDSAGGILDGLEDIAGDIDSVIKPGIDNILNGGDALDNQLRITVLNVDQGLSVLFESDGKYMLYDGGDRATSSYVVAYLKEHGVTELEYMVASHYDSDHIAGLVGVLATVDVKNVINPAYKVTTKIYESYINGVEASEANVIYPNVGDEYQLGNALITVLAPAKDYGDANEMSVALRVDCGKFSCIVTGDAEGKSEADMLKSGIDLVCDVYIVGHHGSSSSSSDAFVKAMDPKFGIISCGKDNDYGHPTDQTLQTLSKYDVEVYRTDLSGTIICTTDGRQCSFKMEK